MLNEDYLALVKLAVKNAISNGVTMEDMVWEINDAIWLTTIKDAEIREIIPYPDPVKLAIVTPVEHREFQDHQHESVRVNMFVTGQDGRFANIQVSGWDTWPVATFRLSELPFPIMIKIKEGHRFFAANVILPAATSHDLHPVRWEVR